MALLNGWLVVMAAWALMTASNANAWVKHTHTDDDEIKAVYLYRFAQLTDWYAREGGNTHYQYCTDSTSGVSRHLKLIIEDKADNASFKKIGGRKAKAATCDILFTVQNDPNYISYLKKRYEDTLLVGDGNAFVRSGGMIGFIHANGQLKPLVNLDNLQSSPFRLRSQLLSIAVIDEGSE